MQRRQRTTLAVFMPLLVFAFGAAAADCIAQNLQTQSANQTQFYGQWSPPAESKTASATIQAQEDAARDRFRELFPPSNLKPIAQDHPTQTNRVASNTFSQKPAPIPDNFPKARPLQPMGQSGFLQSGFSQEPQPGGDFAHVDHHEASTAEGLSPLPELNSSAPWSTPAPQLNATAEMSDASAADSPLSGMIGSMQSGGKDLWSQFQANGGWGEQIAGFFQGSDNRFKKVFGSLAVVIGIYLGFVWLMRKLNFSSNRHIPSEVIEVVGNAPFGPKKSLQLVRLGSKLLLLISGPEGTHPVGEITDANEVDYLISLCKGRGAKASRSVLSVVKQFGQRTQTQSQSLPGRTLQPTTPPPAETTFSTAQLVQALESIQPNRSNTVFEA